MRWGDMRISSEESEISSSTSKIALKINKRDSLPALLPLDARIGVFLCLELAGQDSIWAREIRWGRSNGHRVVSGSGTEDHVTAGQPHPPTYWSSHGPPPLPCRCSLPLKL